MKLNKKNYKQIIAQSTKALKEGKLVVLPTDTVYGLCADAKNKQAVEKLIGFKKRNRQKPISVFAKDLRQAQRIVKISREQKKTIDKFIPGPFTFVFDYKNGVDSSLPSLDKTLGIRIADYKFINDLTAEFDGFITATSANISGRGPHYQISDLYKTLSLKKKQMLDLVVDAGKLPFNKPSTVVDLTSEDIKILRQGDYKVLGIKEKSTISYFSKTEYQTREIARRFSDLSQQKSKRAVVLILTGEMGAGKTVFVKGFAERFGIEDIKSPTFIICREHKISRCSSRSKLYHIDLFRFADSREFEIFNFKELLREGNIVCIEWGQKSAAVFDFIKKNAEVYFIHIDYLSQKKRKITIKNENNT